jgi:chemotaxis protein CheX
MRETGNEQSGQMTLPAVVDLPFAATLKAQLVEGLAAGNGMSIDGSGVQRISSPCLQVLVAGMNAFAVSGVPLAIVDPSPAFVETVSTLGLRDALRLGGA